MGLFELRGKKALVPGGYGGIGAAIARGLCEAGAAVVEGVAGLALAIILVWPRLKLRVPGPFVALIVTSVLAAVMDLQVETIGSRYGQIGSRLPSPSPAAPGLWGT